MIALTCDIQSSLMLMFSITVHTAGKCTELLFIIVCDSGQDGVYLFALNEIDQLFVSIVDNDRKSFCSGNC